MIKRNSCHGATTVFIAAVVLPLMFLLFTLSLDLAKYYTETQRDQKILDDAALYAYRFLPYEQEAINTVRSYVARYPEITDNLRIKASTAEDLIELRLERPAKLMFPKLLGAPSEIPLAVFSRSRGTPFDSLILMDASSYLAPNIYSLNESADAWGDIGEWPAAYFFEELYPVTREGGQVIVHPRVVTQQCFNPAFSALKRSAIHLYEYLSSFGMNAIGVGFFPDDGLYFTSIRDVVSISQRATGPGEVDFDRYIGEYNSSERCAAAAEREVNLSSPYRFPNYNSRLEKPNWNPPAGRPQYLTQDGSWELNPDALPFLRAREVIWSQAIREGHQTNTPEVLRNLHARLVGSYVQAARGGLATRVVKTGIILSGDLPRALSPLTGNPLRYPGTEVENQLLTVLSEIRNDVSIYQDLQVKIYYVVFSHAGNLFDDPANHLEQLSNLFLQARIDSSGQIVDRFDIQLIYLTDPTTLVDNLSPALVFDKKTAVLSR